MISNDALGSLYSIMDLSIIKPSVAVKSMTPNSRAFIESRWRCENFARISIPAGSNCDAPLPYLEQLRVRFLL